MVLTQAYKIKVKRGITHPGFNLLTPAFDILVKHFELRHKIAKRLLGTGTTWCQTIRDANFDNLCRHNGPARLAHRGRNYKRHQKQHGLVTHTAGAEQSCRQWL